MKIDQVAAQLYTVRDHLKTPADIAASLRRVREIGYRAVQLSGLGPIDVKELRKLIDDEGLVCCATHEPSNLILNETAAVIDRLSALGCKHTAYPFPAGFDLSNPSEVQELARKLDAAGAKMREAGLTLSYHNHGHEWARIGDKLIIDIILDETSPENLKAELDTYWVQFGGGDPVAWCKKVAGRMPLLHMKDYGFSAKKYKMHCP